MTDLPDRQLHLGCNSHLDPVWLWDWEEGIAAAVATLRTAVEICEEHPNFVFNQNEALLYEWVEDHEPELMPRIRRLVRLGRWHIMGGWFLQPDCNMPAGEGIVRQIEYGRRYFRSRFGCRPTTAINFDSFGHSRGLVQILQKSGFDSYVFCRPAPGEPEAILPFNLFRWIGFDGSEILARRCQDGYTGLLGEAVAKVERYLRAWPRAQHDLILWGVGNHGGGPSRLDIEALDSFRSQHPKLGLRHSTPEAYFRAVRRSPARIPKWSNDLNPWGVGCYSSQVRVKQEYRRLENDLFLTEKLCTFADLVGAVRYPHRELAVAERDLLLTQFHDILPGSSVPQAERSALRLMAHASEQLVRLRRKPLFAFAANSPRAREGECAIFVFNPHPYELHVPIECEVQMENQNWGKNWYGVEISDSAGRDTPSQMEKEAANIDLDWRKKVVFSAKLPPSRVSRFTCRFLPAGQRPPPPQRQAPGRKFSLADGQFVLDATCGDVRDLRRGTKRVLVRAFQPAVFADSGDPWSSTIARIDRQRGEFRLLSSHAAAAFAGIDARSLDPVRIVEEGPVRTVVESLWGYRDSRLALSVTIPAEGAWLDVHCGVRWCEHSRALKLGITLPRKIPDFSGQTMFGVQSLPCDGRECTAQRWVVVKGAGEGAIGVMSDSGYGYSVIDHTLWITLLRSPYYSALPLPRRPIVPDNRFHPVVDQGMREFRLRLLLDPDGQLPDAIERMAQAWNEAPIPYCYYPGSPAKANRAASESPIRISNSQVILSSARIEPGSRMLRLRLYCAAPSAQRATLELPVIGLTRRLRFGPFEVKTVVIDPARRTFRAVAMA